jgi:hypothetical protein
MDESYDPNAEEVVADQADITSNDNLAEDVSVDVTAVVNETEKSSTEFEAPIDDNL